MRAYGVRRKDVSMCCPGHDKYPKKFYTCTKISVRNRVRRSAKKRERQYATVDQ